MEQPRPISRLALFALFAALFVALGGLALQRNDIAPFWGGLLLAFGEAALVGGLADWFAVRALFGHPMGIPFPHTALIPRSRKRIIKEISNLVQKEWLPQSLLISKIESLDFVRQALLPVIEPMRPLLRDLLRNVGRDLLKTASPDDTARVLGETLARSMSTESVGPFLAGLARRAADQRWLEPMLREWAQKLHNWAESADSRTVIRNRLERAAMSYQERSFMRALTYELASRMGGINLDEAADAIQEQLRLFAEDQLKERSPMNKIVRDGLYNIERRLREEPDFLKDLKEFVLDTSQHRELPTLLRPMLVSLREVALEQMEKPEGGLLDWTTASIDSWLNRLSRDQELCDRVNAWCRDLAKKLLAQHHSLIGTLVEEQLDLLSEEKLTALIQDRVGEDLSWIRLNGTFVGGLIGVALYLLFHAI